MLLFLFLLVGASVPAFGQNCSLQLGGITRSFEGCLPLNNLGSNANLMWTVSGSGQQVTWGLNTTTNGYVGVGFPTGTNGIVMVGTNAFILQSCEGCSTGAQLKQIYMAASTSGNMEPSNNIPTQGTQAQAGPGDWLVATFTTPPVTPVNATLVITAGGGVYRNGAIRQHSQYAQLTLNLLTGGLQSPQYSSTQVSALVAAHIWLLIVGWGFLAPLGIVIARSLKSKDPLWFQLHRALMTLGLIMGIVGLALGFVVAGGWEGVFPVHRNLGMASIILGVCQATAWVLRPKLSSGLRRGWNLWHWWEGRAAIVLGVANIYYGLCKIIVVGAWSWAVYTAVFVVICLIPIAKESLQYLRLPPPVFMKKEDYAGWRPTLTGVDPGIELPYKQHTAGDASAVGEDTGDNGNDKDSSAQDPAGSSHGVAVA